MSYVNYMLLLLVIWKLEVFEGVHPIFAVIFFTLGLTSMIVEGILDRKRIRDEVKKLLGE